MNFIQVVEASAEGAALLTSHMMSSLMCLSLLAILTAAFTCFLDFLLEDHPIGKKYLSLIQKLPVWIAKPLGECPYCSGAWQWLIISNLICDFQISLCLIFLGLNHLSLLLLYRLQQNLLK